MSDQPETIRGRLEQSAIGRRVNDAIDAADAAVVVTGATLAGQIRDGVDGVREAHHRKQDFREIARQDREEAKALAKERILEIRAIMAAERQLTRETIDRGGFER